MSFDRERAELQRHGELKTRTVRGAAIKIASQVLNFAFQLASISVLARLVKPPEHGLVQMATAMTAFLSIFANMGLGTATVQKEKLTHEQISTLFWLNAGAGALLSVAVAATSPLVAWFYGEPRLVGLTAALGIGFVLAGVAAQHSALLVRRMRFGRLAVVDLAALAVGVGTGIACAVWGWGAWAIVAAGLSRTAARGLGVWVASGWVPSLPVRGSGVRVMARFGGYLTGFRFLNYFAKNMDRVLLGRFLGKTQVGFYGKAYGLMMLPVPNVSAPISSVLVPALSRMQGDRARMERVFVKAAGMIAAVCFPLSVGMFVLAEDMVMLVLGPDWQAAIPLLRVLALAGLARPMLNVVGTLFISTGRTDRLLLWSFFGAPVAVASFAVGLRWGGAGVAVAYSVALLGLMLPSIYVVAFRMLGFSLWGFVTRLVRPLLAAAAMGCGVRLLSAHLGAWHRSARFGVLVASGAMLYALLSLLVSRQLVREGWELVRGLAPASPPAEETE